LETISADENYVMSDFQMGIFLVFLAIPWMPTNVVQMKLSTSSLVSFNNYALYTCSNIKKYLNNFIGLGLKL
jgi:hypothetical protein